LEQHGLQVASASLIPIKLDFEYESEFEIKALNKINAPLISELQQHPLKRQVLSVAGTTAGKQAEHIRNKILPVRKEINSELLERVLKVYNGFIPGVEIDTNVHKREASAEFIKSRYTSTLSSSHPQYINGYRYSFARVELHDTKYYKTEDDLNDAINDYVEKINSKRINKISDFGRLIASEFAGEKDYTKLGENFQSEKQAMIHEQFKKYFLQPG